MTNINNKVLAEIAERNPTAESFFTYAACRERNVKDGMSSLSAIKAQMAKEGFHPVPQDLLQMFKELERAGVGELKNGMFKWHVSIKEIGKAVELPKVEAATQDPVKSVIKKAQKDLIICFDSNKEVSVTFTPNLTKEQISFIAERLLNECRE